MDINEYDENELYCIYPCESYFGVHLISPGCEGLDPLWEWLKSATDVPRWSKMCWHWKSTCHFRGASKRKKPWRLVFCKIFGYTWTDTRCNLIFFQVSIHIFMFFLHVPTLVILCKSSCQDIHPSNSHTSSQAELEVQPGKHNARMNYSVGEWCV